MFEASLAHWLPNMCLGAAFDNTSRDDYELSLIGDVSFNTQNNDGTERTLYLSYAEASQVAGYTAIGGSESGGLFRSNANLERETTKSLELGLLLEQQSNAHFVKIKAH